MDKRLVFLFMLIPFVFFSQVGINTTTPSSASVLDVNSSGDGVNFGGFMPPRVSLAERNSINPSTSDDGLMVFLIDGTTRCVQLWNGVDSTWDNVYCMPINQAPVANNVTVSGTFQVGEIITASFIYTDAENDPAGFHTYTWFRADDNVGTNQTQLQTGPSNSFTITASELNKYIAVEVTPVATSGTSPGSLASSIYYGPVTNPSATASDLFISEYVEGSGNNKIIEVANFTGASVDLSNYQINIYSNGSLTPSSTTLLTGGILADGSVFVIANPGTLSPCNSNINQTSGNISFNGNDVVELTTTSNVTIDIIGVIGDSSNFAIDITLRKKTGVGPNTTYNVGDYDTYLQDTCNDIGSHTY